MIKNWLNKIVLLVFLMLVNMIIVSAQDLEKDLKQITLKYTSIDRIMISKTINYYKNNKDKTPTETSKTIVKKDTNKLYTNAFDVETVISNGLSVLVDHKSKTMILAENKKGDLETSLDIDFSPIKELSKEIKFKKKKEEGVYIFYLNKGEYIKLELWFNIETHEVKKIVYFLREALPTKQGSQKKIALPKLEVLFTSTKINCDFEEGTFKLEQFITVSDEGVTPVSKYKNYKLINNIGI